MTDALILAGGVAKGAFTAGVLSVLLGPEGKATRPTDIHSIVAASSGALNGAYVAAVLHAGTEEADIGRLGSIWLDEAAFGQVFEPSFAGVFGLRGASGEDKVLDLLRRHITPTPRARTIELRLVVANMAGNLEQVGGAPATTFETVLPFDAATFEDGAKLETMFQTVTASAAFPGAFLPVPLEIDGRTVACVDGGAVNNTPLGYALEHPFGIDRVFVVSPQPRVSVQNPRDLKGLGLITHLAEMLLEERLFRDLRGAYEMNAALGRLEKIVPDPEVRAQVLDTIGWGGRKQIAIVELRPPVSLPGDMFDGFFSRDLREAYVRSGEETARAWLGAKSVSPE
jgi:predicted acylesterase/phospholipase RssA